MAKESICRSCFHSYVCEQFDENRDDNNEKCHFFNDHYVPTADVVPKSEVAELLDELWVEIRKIASDYPRGALLALLKLAELKKKYTEESV